jgi:UDP-N-acetyl-D-glucosamine dehydrogenase
LTGRRSVDLDPQTVASYDAIVVATDHDPIDWPSLAAHGRLVIDTRNVFARKGLFGPNVVKA